MTAPITAAASLAEWPDADVAAVVRRTEALVREHGLSRRFAHRQARREIALQRQERETERHALRPRRVA